MADPASSPDLERATVHRVSSFKSFLPLLSNDSTALSTRGQNLPLLLQQQSSGHVPISPLPRRSSVAIGTIRSHSDHYSPNGRSEESLRSSTDDDDLETFRRSFTMPWAAHENRRSSDAASILNTPEVRSQRLIGNSNPRYRWEQYYKSEEELKQMKKPLRKYYERNNYLIQHYLYIDRLLDSSLPHNLIQEYSHIESSKIRIPSTIAEESSNANTAASTPAPHTPIYGFGSSEDEASTSPLDNGFAQAPSQTIPKIKRTPKNLYKVPESDENTPLLRTSSPSVDEDAEVVKLPELPEWVPEEDEDSQSPIVRLAIAINLAANTALLVMKIIVTIMTSSLSVIASLVDAALDFLSTFIVGITGWMISRQDRYKYPVGRRRLEPIGVLVFSVIMITSFCQVAIEGFSRLTGQDHKIVQLSVPAVAIMSCTVLVKGLCWLWCRLIRNSSVQALAQDAMTDVVFNTFSIIFPLIGYFTKVWWMDPLGGLLLSLYVIINWSRTSATHIRNLTGAAASADERNILLYTTMRFAKTIKQIQGIEAYHAGDKLNVEVDIVVDEHTSLRDSHDLGESLQYVLESIPYVDRAFVHIDYTGYNLPSHMSQQE